MSFVIINYENYDDNLIFYESSFSSFISLKSFIILTSSFNLSVMFIINSINVILFGIIDLIISLFRVFIVEAKRVDVILKEKLNSNKRAYVKNAIDKFNFFVRK